MYISIAPEAQITIPTFGRVFQSISISCGSCFKGCKDVTDVIIGRGAVISVSGVVDLSFLHSYLCPTQDAFVLKSAPQYLH